jgi:hypothetical protein
MSMRYWIFFGLLFFAWACGKKPQHLTSTIAPLPEMDWSAAPSKSIISLPVSISLKKVENMINRQLPWIFHNPEWPAFTYAPCGQPDICFEVKRDSIRLKCEGNTLFFELDLAYAISGQICATCWGEKCVTPKVPFSCGSGKEGMRKMNWKGKMIWGIDDHWKLKTISSNVYLTPYNPCELTFLKLDFTKEVTSEMEKALKQSLADGDKYFSSLDFASKLKPWLDASMNGYPVGEYGFLSAQILQLYIGNLRSDRDSIYADVGLEGIFQFKKNKTSNAASPLPKVVMMAPPHKNSEVNLQGTWNWTEWNELVNPQLLEHPWILDSDGGQVILRQSEFKSAEKGKVHGDWILDIQKGKWKVKNVHLSADMTVNWNKEQQMLSVQNIEWDIDSRHQLLKWGIQLETWNEEWAKSKMFDFKFTSYYPTMINKVNDMIRTLEKNGVRINGEVMTISVEKCEMSPLGIILELKAIGKLQGKVKVLNWSGSN